MYVDLEIDHGSGGRLQNHSQGSTNEWLDPNKVDGVSISHKKKMYVFFLRMFKN